MKLLKILSYCQRFVLCTIPLMLAKKGAKISIYAYFYFVKITSSFCQFLFFSCDLVFEKLLKLKFPLQRFITWKK